MSLLHWIQRKEQTMKESLNADCIPPESREIAWPQPAACEQHSAILRQVNGMSGITCSHACTANWLSPSYEPQRNSTIVCIGVHILHIKEQVLFWLSIWRSGDALDYNLISKKSGLLHAHLKLGASLSLVANIILLIIAVWRFCYLRVSYTQITHSWSNKPSTTISERVIYNTEPGHKLNTNQFLACHTLHISVDELKLVRQFKSSISLAGFTCRFNRITDGPLPGLCLWLSPRATVPEL